MPGHAVRVDHIRGNEIVTGCTESPQEPPESTAEREPCHADGGVTPKDRRETMSTGRRVQFTRTDAGLDARGTASGVNYDRLHPRHINDDPAVTDGGPQHIVSTSAHCDFNGLRTAKID